MADPDPNLSAATGGNHVFEIPADEWPEQFKDPRDVVKSYEESRKEMDRLRSELDQERQQFAAALQNIEQAQQTPAPQQFQAGTDPRILAYQQAVEAGDATAQLGITLGLFKEMQDAALDEKLSALTPKLDTQAQADRDIAFTMAQERIKAEYGEKWEEIAPDVNAWLHEHSAWLPAVNSPDAFAQVIREGARTVEGVKASERLAALEAERSAKLSAATATGGGNSRFPTATPEKEQEWAEIKGAQIGSYGAIAKG